MHVLFGFVLFNVDDLSIANNLSGNDGLATFAHNAMVWAPVPGRVA